MFKHMEGVLRGRQLLTKEENSSSCMFGRIVPLYIVICFVDFFCLKFRFLKGLLVGIYIMFVCILSAFIVCKLHNV